MKMEKKKHTKASLNIYLIAGIYLLYLDYSLISKWSEGNTSERIMGGVAIIAFTIFAIGLIIYSLKGTIGIVKVKEDKVEEITSEEDIVEEIKDEEDGDVK